MAIMVDTESSVLDQVIKVVGVGGGGGNAVNHMIEQGIKGVEYIAVNTDARDLQNSSAETKVQIGVKLTGGRGAGAKPEIGAASAEENRDEIKAALSGAHMVFITACMGGGTGTGAAPIIAQVAQELGILTVGVVTKPFAFERQKKMDLAEAGIAQLRGHVDSLIVIPNQKLLEMNPDQSLSFIDQFNFANDILKTAVKGIAELITVDGYMNVDFSDVKTIMTNGGYAHMTTGHGTGTERAKNAAEQAIASPLLETTLAGATKILINITTDRKLGLGAINEIINLVTDAADPDALVIPGIIADSELDDEVFVTVIAAAYNDDITISAAPSMDLGIEKISLDSTQLFTTPAAAQTRPVQKSSSGDDDYSSLLDMINNRG